MSPPKKILLVDDEPEQAAFIGKNLQRNGYELLLTHDSATGLEMARKCKPDLLILDLMKSAFSGRDIITALRQDSDTAKLPILMLAPETGESDIIVALSLGADDYVTKPFSMPVLMARVAALLRQISPLASARLVLQSGSLVIDQTKLEVTVDDLPVSLTRTEYNLLKAIVEAQGRVLTRDKLRDCAFESQNFTTDRTMDVHVAGVRRKLRDMSWMLHTVRGVGYRWLEKKD